MIVADVRCGSCGRATCQALFWTPEPGPVGVLRQLTGTSRCYQCHSNDWTLIRYEQRELPK